MYYFPFVFPEFALWPLLNTSPPVPKRKKKMEKVNSEQEHQQTGITQFSLPGKGGESPVLPPVFLFYSHYFHTHTEHFTPGY